MKEHCFNIGDKIVTHVDVLGIVVSVSSLCDNTLFEKDVGTGMISCITFGKDMNVCQSSEKLKLMNQLHIQIEDLGA